MPLLADEKDVKIAKLEALLRKAKAGQKGSQVRKPAVQEASKAPVPSPPREKPLRRIGFKQPLDHGMLCANASGETQKEKKGSSRAA